MLHTRKVDAPAVGVAEELPSAFLVAEQDGFLACGHTAGKKVGDQQGFSGARRAADERDAVTEKASAAHFVDFRIAAGHANGSGFLLQPQRRQGHRNQTDVSHHCEWSLALGVVATAHFEDLDRTPPALSLKNVAQNDHVVGDEFLQSMPGNLAILAVALGSHQHGEPALLERVADTKKLAPQDLRIADEMVEELSEGIEHHSLGFDLLHGVLDARE